MIVTSDERKQWIQGAKDENWTPVGYDLTFDWNSAEYEKHNGGVLVSSVEQLNLPEDVVARIVQRNSSVLQRCSVAAPLYQPGHTGVNVRVFISGKRNHLDELRVKNLGVATVVFERLCEEVEPYRGQYYEPEDEPEDEGSDMVNHPPHYTAGGIEVIDFIDFMVYDPADYYIGNVVKYLSRAGKKGNKIEDYRKARWYLNRMHNYCGDEDEDSSRFLQAFYKVFLRIQEYCEAKDLPLEILTILWQIKLTLDTRDGYWLKRALAELDALIEQEVKDGHSI